MNAPENNRSSRPVLSALAAALHGRLVNGLITNEAMAEGLLAAR